MKTLTVRIYDSAGQEIAWVCMSSRRQLECVMPEIGGPESKVLDLMPSRPWDITTLGCLAAAAAQDAGLDYCQEWQGRWELEPSTPDDSETL